MLKPQFLEDLKRYVDKHQRSFTHEKQQDRLKMLSEKDFPGRHSGAAKEEAQPDAQVFRQKLAALMDLKMTLDTYVYKKAGLKSRQIAELGKPDKLPAKQTVLLLGLALELTTSELAELLLSAGYSFANTQTDLAVKYCIEHRIYAIPDVNNALHSLGLPALG